MGRWYLTREALKRAVGVKGPANDQALDLQIEAASCDVETSCNRRFIPVTKTLQFKWPQKGINPGGVLYLSGHDGDDLLAVTALTRDDDDATAISASDYFLEPQTVGPPYSRIEIDQSSSAYFAFKNTQQRAVRVTGRWAYSEDTKAAGATASAMTDTTGTSVNVTDSSLVGVGDSLLVDSEQLFVTAKTLLDTTANTAGALTADASERTVAVNTGTLVKAGEIITIDAERMLVESISGNNLTVERAVDGSVLATHANPSDVYAPRTLTVERGSNGTTAATHLTAASLSRYVPPADISRLCMAIAIHEYEQDRGGRTGSIGGGEATIEGRGAQYETLRKRTIRQYKRTVIGAV